jgi:peptide/nickel transport system substrate-binding protein
MKTSLRYRISLLTTGLLVAGLVGWIPAANAVQKATSVKSDTLVVAESTAPLTFDPTQSDAITSWYPWALVYDSLFRVRKDGSYAPMLAMSWAVSADRLTYTFNLRKGVKFQNGDPFTADDVIFSYQRLLDRGVPYANA